MAATAASITRVCAHCQDMLEQGRQWEIVEAVAAGITVRDHWSVLDPEQWRRHEHELIGRWLAVRTTCEAIEPHGRRNRSSGPRVRIR